MNNLEEDALPMVRGIKQLLGQEEYDPPERLLICEHVSDGFIYEETPVFVTLRCNKCGLHYDQSRL